MNDEGASRCETCGQTTMFEPWAHHLLDHQIKRRAFQCPECDAIDIVEQRFREHLEMMHNIEVDDMEWHFRSRGPFKKLFGCPLSSTCIYFVESSQKLDDHMVRRHHTLPSDTDLERARTREEMRMSGRTSMERDLEEEVRRIVISKSGEKEETVVRLRPTDAELVSEDFLQRRPSEPPYTRFCNCLLIMITFYTLLITSLFCIDKPLFFYSHDVKRSKHEVYLINVSGDSL